MRWAEFGSVMAGIYTPIVGLTTFTVILAQVGLQKQINDHSFNQAHIAQARADIEFFAIQLAEKLNQIALPGQTYRHILHSNFQPLSQTELDSERLRTLAADINEHMPSLWGMWGAIYPILIGLEAGDEQTFHMTLSSSLQKLQALLGFETCVTLDNFYRVKTEGRLNIAYKFSSLLEAKHTV